MEGKNRKKEGRKEKKNKTKQWKPWARPCRWWANFAVWDRGGGSVFCDSKTGHAEAGTERSTNDNQTDLEKKIQWFRPRNWKKRNSLWRCSCWGYCRNRPYTASGLFPDIRRRASAISPCGQCRAEWLHGGRKKTDRISTMVIIMWYFAMAIKAKVIGREGGTFSPFFPRLTEKLIQSRDPVCPAGRWKLVAPRYPRMMKANPTLKDWDIITNIDDRIDKLPTINREKNK